MNSPYVAAVRWIGAIAGLSVASLAHCADGPVEKPDVKVGDRWTYQATDLRRNRELRKYQEVVTFVGNEIILTTSTWLSNQKEFDSHWTAEWNALALGAGEVYEEPRRFFRFPLNVGDTFEIAYRRVQRGSPMKIANNATVRVVAWEEVAVPAGKFRALKVEIKGSYQRLDERGGGWFMHTIWYEPGVKRWVKYIFERGNPSPSEKTGRELLMHEVN
jgi:hypothetical protein